MTVIRSFIALEIPDTIQQRLESVAARLQSRLPSGSVRWVGSHNIHLTLVFLGEVSAASLADLGRELKAEASQHSPVEFSVGGLGAFPTPARPRVIWVGIEAPPALPALQGAVQMRLARLGYPGDDKPFSPHLTLGRVNKTASTADVRQVGAALQAEKVGFLGTVQAAEICLVKSDLKPGGPVYTMMDRFPLIATP